MRTPCSSQRHLRGCVLGFHSLHVYGSWVVRLACPSPPAPSVRDRFLVMGWGLQPWVLQSREQGLDITAARICVCACTKQYCWLEAVRYLGDEMSCGSPSGKCWGHVKPQPGVRTHWSSWGLICHPAAGTLCPRRCVTSQAGRAALFLVGGAGWEMFSCAKEDLMTE